MYEEPRLREQDFGNFQPASTEMERMWQERADYGHFFYRIPNGESAADAYDRISGFNESLWRQFGEADFPRVCVMVTHGLMTRVFLMKWYHWSVEYFEDLRNVNHCEFVVMKLGESGKYVLENSLRTWTELKRQRAEREHREVREMGRFEKHPSRRNTLSAFLTFPVEPEGTAEKHDEAGRKEQQEGQPAPPAEHSDKTHRNERDDHALAHQEPNPHDGSSDSPPTTHPSSVPSYLSRHMTSSTSGADTPHEMPSDDETDHTSYFPAQPSPAPKPAQPRSIATAMRKRPPERKPTEEDIERWTQESGMGSGRQADALGDEPSQGDEVPDQDGAEAFGERMREKLELEREEVEDKSLRGSVY